MSSSQSRAGWSFSPHRRRAEITDILRREFGARASDVPDTTYDSGPVSALHDALDRALKLDDASKQVVRPIISGREIAELLRERFGNTQSETAEDDER